MSSGEFPRLAQRVVRAANLERLGMRSIPRGAKLPQGSSLGPGVAQRVASGLDPTTAASLP